MKICSKCKIEKPFSEFHTHKSNKDGLQYQCKQCRKETCAKSFSKRYTKNKKEILAKCTEYYWKNRDAHLQKLKKYRESSKGKATKCNLQRQREAAKFKRTPKWADQEKIKAYYDVCAFFNEVNGYTKYHVDHIVPLKGNKVSGLHVHNNLQILPAKENMSKGNKYNG